MSYGEILMLGAVALALANGFLIGALWHSKVHLADLRAHTRWTDEYTRDVVKLLDDMAVAFGKRGDE